MFRNGVGGLPPSGSPPRSSHSAYVPLRFFSAFPSHSPHVQLILSSRSSLVSSTSPSRSPHVAITSPSRSPHFPPHVPLTFLLMFPSGRHYLPLTSPSGVLHVPPCSPHVAIMSFSYSHHVPHHVAPMFPSCRHHVPVTFPSHPLTMVLWGPVPCGGLGIRFYDQSLPAAWLREVCPQSVLWWFLVASVDEHSKGSFLHPLPSERWACATRVRPSACCSPPPPGSCCHR